MKYIYILILVFFSKNLFACDLTQLNLDNDLNSLGISDDQKNLIINIKTENFTEHHFPVELICKNAFQDFSLEIFTFENKIFKIKYLNFINKDKPLLSLSKKIYGLDFKFNDQNLNNNFLNSQILDNNKYSYYTFSSTKDNFFEVFEIINPNIDNMFRQENYKKLEN